MQAISAHESNERTVATDWDQFAVPIALFVIGAFGVPNEGVTQSTFKWLMLALGSGLWVAAALWRREHLHLLLLKPSVGALCLLGLWAISSMAWSHSYMGFQAAAAWAVTAMVAMYFGRATAPSFIERALKALWLGAVVASLTGVVQYLLGWSWIEQAVAPASTFANRNLAAEYLVCALPFGVYLAIKGGAGEHRWMWGGSVGLVAAFVVMTGSRAAYAAMIAMAICASLIMRGNLRELVRHRRAVWLGATYTVTALLLIPSFATGMEYAGMTGLERAAYRVFQTGEEYRAAYGSLALRWQMWSATVAMVLDSPFVGVGAGAWEIEIPRFLVLPTLLEPDYFAHNEPLQLLAEYGFIGACALAFWLYGGARYLVKIRVGSLEPERAIHMTALCGLIGVSVTACAGFPLHQAGTMAIVGICLGLQSRQQTQPNYTWLERSPSLAFRVGAVATVTLPLACIAYFATQTRVEAVLIDAVASARQYGLTGAKKADLQEVRDAAVHQLQDSPIFEHAHRVYLPAIATAVAKAGDMETAVYLWQGVLRERPNLVALKCVLLKGNAAIGDMGRALEIYADPLARPCQNEFDDAVGDAKEAKNDTGYAVNSQNE